MADADPWWQDPTPVDTANIEAMAENEGLSFEEMIAQMDADEAHDALEEAEFLSIGDYARGRGIRPQKIHYYLSNGKLKRHRCLCGRWVIKVAEADAIFVKVAPSEETDEDG